MGCVSGSAEASVWCYFCDYVSAELVMRACWWLPDCCDIDGRDELPVYWLSKTDVFLLCSPRPQSLRVMVNWDDVSLKFYDDCFD